MEGEDHGGSEQRTRRGTSGGFVVGGGASGALVTANLLRSATAGHAVDVRVIERDGEVGPGLAYGTQHPRHLLNNYAGRLSVFEQEPDHLLQ